MGSSSRKQVYPFQYKSNSVTTAAICGGNPATAGPNYPRATILGVSVPDNILRMTSLWVHLVITFDSREAIANQAISAFSVGNVTQGYVNGVYTTTLPTNGNVKTNVVSNGNVIDFSINLQSLLPYIYYFPSTANSSAYFELTFISPSLVYLATINLWKVDMIYTTLGIR